MPAFFVDVLKDTAKNYFMQMANTFYDESVLFSTIAHACIMGNTSTDISPVASFSNYNVNSLLMEPSLRESLRVALTDQIISLSANMSVHSFKQLIKEFKHGEQFLSLFKESSASDSLLLPPEVIGSKEFDKLLTSLMEEGLTNMASNVVVEEPKWRVRVEQDDCCKVCATIKLEYRNKENGTVAYSLTTKEICFTRRQLIKKPYQRGTDVVNACGLVDCE